MNSDFHFTSISGVNMSLLSQEELQAIHSLLQLHGVTLCRISNGRRLEVYGKELDTVALERAVRKVVPPQEGITVSSVQCCPGPDRCKHAIADTRALGRQINRLSFSRPLPHKVKVGIAGCSRCCTEPYIRDIGVIARRKGWTVVVGGNGGGRPRIADIVVEGITRAEVIDVVGKILDFYMENGSPRQRTARFIEQIGIDTLKREIL